MVCVYIHIFLNTFFSVNYFLKDIYYVSSQSRKNVRNSNTKNHQNHVNLASRIFIIQNFFIYKMAGSFSFIFRDAIGYLSGK